MSNSKNMTLEDKLVQNIKETQLGALIGDEDALAQLTKRAIDEALFKPITKTEGGGYNARTTTEPSLIVQVAREQAQKAIDKLLESQIKEIMANPQTREALQEAIAGLFPSMILRRMDQEAVAFHQIMQRDAMVKLQQVFFKLNDTNAANAAVQVQNEHSGFHSGASPTIGI